MQLTTAFALAGTIPKRIDSLIAETEQHILPIQRELRVYPRYVIAKPRKYPVKRKGLSALN
ncbi:hypothetical protein B4O99_17235 [Shewanella xiamenensis]|jgi:hypothetical protein|nr:hypothetical protein [Shewanella xiamenensis]PWH02731.1 hypothetical protein DIY08_11020 [Shewanella xiamenensis]TVL36208.1 hypothetical protein AYI95_01725 [Shewanella xiamenensis]